MPKRTELQHVLVIGSGPIVIGQASEFDYSGTQACRVLKAEGLRVSLVNSNPATIMTDPEVADATYIEPLTPEFVERVIAAERPDALLATLGGQTALNIAIGLYENGVLDKYGVQLIGADVDAINRGEDRQMFKDIVRSIGADAPRSTVCSTVEEALATAEEVGYPVVIRPSFTMGGLGSGIATDEPMLRRMAGHGLADSPVHTVLIEESVLGWKEFELELMRDRSDNVVVVCSIENIDAMGVHTGDSVTVAPAMTLTDREYQQMRDVGIAVLRAVGVDTGGCNIQFAVHPETGRLVVIEMNPRVSRSSALASKATGFPIAKIAAKLAIGYTLDEITNDITGVTPASFEPALDYVVVKIPRFAFEKFPGADPRLTTTMKSVGEVMAMGRNFTEALGKAMRSTETTAAGFWTTPEDGPSAEELLEELRTPVDGRLYTAQRALAAGATVEQVSAASGFDTWFVDQIALVTEVGEQVREAPSLTAELLRLAKRHGLCDRQVAELRPELAGEDGVRPAALAAGHPAGLQDRGHLRRRVRRADAVPLLLLRRGDRGRAAGAPGGADPGLGPEPDRAGRGVRLLLRARGDGPAGRRLRGGDGQLQPGDRLHRLRHRRPAVLRAADLRGRPGGRRGRARRRPGRRGHLHPRRADPAGAGAAAQGRRRAGAGHRPGGDRRRRGPRRVLPGAAGHRPARAQARDGDDVRRGQGDRGGHRLPGAGPALLRARRAGHGDRLRGRHARGLHHQGHRREHRPPGAGRPVPRGRDRDRRRRALRRHRPVPGRGHGAHRGGRHPLRRLGVRPAADHPGRGGPARRSGGPPRRSPPGSACAA